MVYVDCATMIEVVLRGEFCASLSMSILEKCDLIAFISISKSFPQKVPRLLGSDVGLFICVSISFVRKIGNLYSV